MDYIIDDDVVELFTQKEKDEIELNISQLIDEFIQYNPLSFSFENFNNLLEEYIYTNTYLILSQI